MIALIPYFLVLFLLSIVWVQPVLLLSNNSKAINPLLLSLTGLIMMSIIGMFMVIGGPINLSSQVLFLLSSALIAWLRKTEINKQLSLIILQIKAWSKLQKIGYLLLAIPILYQSAQASKIHDNGAYYQQTIQWMEQFGLVKGLANLYPALGLFSNWHALTALLDLNQMGLGSYHQINGLLMLLFLAWALNEYFVQEQLFLLSIVGLNCLLGFFYLTAPSADLPLLLYCTLLVYYFIKGIELEQSFILGLVSLGIFLIKPPAIIGLLLFLYLLFINLKNLKNSLLLLTLGMLLIGSFFYKNTILSGYAMYPNQKPDLFDVAWKVPQNWNRIYTQGIVSWGISDSQKVNNWTQNNQTDKPNRFLIWLNRNGYKGFMNKCLFLNFIFALSCLVWFSKKAWHTHKRLLALILFLLLGHVWEWLTLSQYRLMLPTGLGLLVLSLTLFAKYGPKIPLKSYVHQLSFALLILSLMILSFFPFQIFQASSRNKQITSSSGFSTRYLLEPYHQYDYGHMSFLRISGKAFYYYKDTKLSWNCSLPCVSKSHHDFLYENLGYEVQMMGNSPKDGFKMVKKTKELQH